MQYDLKSPEDALFNNRSSESPSEEEDSVRGIAETAIREVVGKNRMDFVLYEGRTESSAESQRTDAADSG